MHKEHATGIPISSANYAFMFKSSSIECLLDPASQYKLLPSHFKIRMGRGDYVIAKMIKLVRLGSKLSETVKGKLSWCKDRAVGRSGESIQA
ncbi:hypothetical protein ACS0TY_035101 [Phlomoides rotata]